jgi:hypothetical protein
MLQGQQISTLSPILNSPTPSFNQLMSTGPPSPINSQLINSSMGNLSPVSTLSNSSPVSPIVNSPLKSANDLFGKNNFQLPIQNSLPIRNQNGLLVNQPLNQSVNQPTNQSVNQPTNQNMNQSVNQNMNQSANQNMNQSANQPLIRNDTPNKNNQDCCDKDKVNDACGTKSNAESTGNCSKGACSTSGYELGYGWGWLGALILWFIIFTVIFWLIYFSLKPTFVFSNDSNQVDTAKVLLSAVISSIILVIIIWLIKLAVTRK